MFALCTPLILQIDTIPTERGDKTQAYLSYPIDDHPTDSYRNDFHLNKISL